MRPDKARLPAVQRCGNIATMKVLIPNFILFSRIFQYCLHLLSYHSMVWIYNPQHQPAKQGLYYRDRKKGKRKEERGKRKILKSCTEKKATPRKISVYSATLDKHTHQLYLDKCIKISFKPTLFPGWSSQHFFASWI